MKILIRLFVLLTLAAAGAGASIITITLDDPNQTGTEGMTLNFFGTITNTDTTPGDAPVFLNNDTFTLLSPDLTFLDNFIANVPISLAEGASSDDIDLFDVALANPATLPYGLYTGTYGLIGGMDGGTGAGIDNLALVSFSVTTAAPEPASLLLFGSGLICTGWLYRRRRTRA